MGLGTLGVARRVGSACSPQEHWAPPFGQALFLLSPLPCPLSSPSLLYLFFLPNFTSFLLLFNHSPIYLSGWLVEYLLYHTKDPAPNLQPPLSVARIRQRQKLL